MLNTQEEPNRGDCIEGPPTATALPMMDQMGRQMGVNVMSAYPDLPDNFPACSRYKASVALRT